MANATKKVTKPSAPATPKLAVKSGRKLVKSTEEVLMLETVRHNKVTYPQGERVILDPEVFATFVEKGYATAVEVTASESNQAADNQSQSAGSDDANEGDDSDKDEE